MAKQIPAQYAGQCRTCGQRSPVGTMITWAKGDGSRHVTCPERPVSASDAPPSPKVETPLVVCYDAGLGRPARDGRVGTTFRLGRYHRQDADKAVTVVRQTVRWIAEDGDSLGLNPGHDRGWLVTLHCREATEPERAKLEAEEAAERAVEWARRAREAEASASKKAAEEAYRTLRAERTAGLVDAGELYGDAIASRRDIASAQLGYWDVTLCEVTFQSGGKGIVEHSWGNDDSRSRLWGSQADVEAAYAALQTQTGTTPQQAQEWLAKYAKCSGTEFFRWVAGQSAAAA